SLSTEWKAGVRKCMHFPRCRPRNGSCQFNHPSRKCSDFDNPNTIYKCSGVNCRYIHPDCPNDGKCQEKHSCRYEHKKSKPTLLNIYNARKDEDESRYSICLFHSGRSHSPSRSPDPTLVNKNAGNRKMFRPDAPSNRERLTKGESNGNHDERRLVQEQITKGGRNKNCPTGRIIRRSQSNGDRKTSIDRVESPDSSENNGRSMNGQTSRARPMKTILCALHPLCPKSHLDCDYIHPYMECRDFKWGCPRGRDCTFVHPECERDGGCGDEECAYTHRRQVHARVAEVYYAHEVRT
ncbi:hypothetical protein PFISCL1PPCAC_1142, partial [Pristionchus fissidentatus]